MELPATEISMPTSNNQSSYYGEYVPGGYNSAGKVECVVKPFTQDEIPEGYSIILVPGTSREKVIK